MILSRERILKEIQTGGIKISPPPKEVGEDAIEIHISKELLSYPPGTIIDTSKPFKKFNKHIIKKTGFIIRPGDFYLAKTAELVTLNGKVMGWLENSGSLAKTGIQIHLCDAHIDSGTNSNITLQISNQGNNPVKLYPNSYIGKLYFLQIL